LIFDAIREHCTGILNDHRICLRAAQRLFSKSSIITPSSQRMMEASMGDVVNLKRFKKRSEREQSAREADANRARFGRTRAERAREEYRKDRAKEILEQHKIDDGDAS
jgi:hypothetical protein